uniref:Uncharacterized protein LOC102801200 n=1 Tax=Saccoglossus kowalevskii TaxID=10224 RepID=A0ABM0MAE0_SACKO|nr:PREDICTED: uncharacterized protein LOC102801200 [Saccoglossus kowalevskii]
MSDNEDRDSVAVDLTQQKKNRTTARRQLTTIMKQIETLIADYDKQEAGIAKHFSIIRCLERNPILWTEFYDTYNAAIHSDNQLSNVQKFTYLRSFLGGEAKRLIDGLAMTDVNYDTAIELLEKRYGNKQDIINAYMTALWDIVSGACLLHSSFSLQ